MSMVNYPITFNGVDLSTVAGLTVLSTNPYAPPKRKLSMFNLARTDKDKVSSAFYSERIITVLVGISQPSRSLLEQSLDSLFTLLQSREKNLILPQSLSTRRYTCTYADYNIIEQGGSYIEMELYFATSDHFGYDINPTTLLQVTNFTSGLRTDQITLGGSADWQVPTSTITYYSITDGTLATVRLGNDATGQSVAVTRTWAANDVLEISAPNNTVKVNGVEVTNSGAIPRWASGLGYVAYSDNFSARTFSNTMSYYKRYV